MRYFAGLLLGGCVPQLISFAGPASAVVIVVVLVLLAASARFSFLAGVLSGLLALQAQLLSLDEAVIAPRYEGDSLVADFRIVDFPVTGESGTRFRATIANHRIIPERVRLTWYEPPAQLRVGDSWRLEVRLRRPSGYRNPGGFDRERADAITSTGASGYVVAGRRNVLLGSDAGFIDAFRQRFVAKVERALPDNDSSAIIAALSVGVRQSISRVQWERHSAAGTTHLIAISGLHVGLVAGFGALLGRLAAVFLCLHVNHRRVALIVSALVTPAYVLVSGSGIPAQRALVMLTILMLGWLLRRESSGFHALSLAGVLVLMHDPMARFTAGFQLSFAAVFVLIWVSRQRMLVGSSWLGAPAGLLSIQMALGFGLLLITAASFGRVTLASPLINLVAVPLFSLFTVPLALLSLLPGTHADLTLALAAFSIEWLESLIDRASPTEWLLSAAMLPRSLSALALGSLLTLLPRGFPGRPAALVCLPVLLWPPLKGPSEGCVDATFLDVGQGTAIVLQTHSHRLLYDTGPAFRGGSAAASQIVPFLRARVRGPIDRLIVSHADSDHSGGLQDLRQQVHIHRIYAGETLDGDDWRYCRSGQSWIWDGVRFEVLHPDRTDAYSGNNASCVLLVSAGKARLLLTGDVEARAERVLIERGIGPVDVMSVPHHGSATSSTPALVDALKPKFSVVSAGYRNRWKLPSDRVVDRWMSVGSVVLNTAEEGALRFRLCKTGDVELVSRHRRDHARSWHRR